MAIGEYCLAIIILATFSITVNSQCGKIPTDDPERVDRCFLLYDALESALLTPENLHILRESFFPPSQRSPSILDIHYSIESITSTNNYSIGWTSSALLSIIDPITLAAFQSGWFYVLEISTILPRQVPIELDIKNHTLPSNISSSEKRSVLKVLTTRVSIQHHL